MEELLRENESLRIEANNLHILHEVGLSIYIGSIVVHHVDLGKQRIEKAC